MILSKGTTKYIETKTKLSYKIQFGLYLERTKKSGALLILGSIPGPCIQWLFFPPNYIGVSKERKEEQNTCKCWWMKPNPIVTVNCLFRIEQNYNVTHQSDPTANVNLDTGQPKQARVTTVEVRTINLGECCSSHLVCDMRPNSFHLTRSGSYWLWPHLKDNGEFSAGVLHWELLLQRPQGLMFLNQRRIIVSYGCELPDVVTLKSGIPLCNNDFYYNMNNITLSILISTHDNVRFEFFISWYYVSCKYALHF